MPDRWDKYIVAEPTDKWDQFAVTRIDEHTGAEIPSLIAAPEPTTLEVIKDYLNIGQPKTTPLDLEAIENRESPYWIREQVFETGRVEEMRRIVGRGFTGITGGLSDVIRGYEEYPETIPGAVLGAGAELGGFLVGPFKGARALIGTRLAPKIGGLARTTQQLIEGGATLGIASGISSILPAFLESESFTNMGMEVLEATETGAMIGMLFPLSAYVPTKPLRLAVGLAVMDKIRAGIGEWFTIDDVYRGLVDGTIDKKVLAERAFGYLMDMYFISKVPSMGKQLGMLKANEMVSEIKKLNVDEVETTLLKLGKQRLLVEEKGDSASEDMIIKTFGSMEEFHKAFKATVPDGGDMAQRVERMYNERDAELTRLRSRTLKETMNKIAAATWDTSPRVKAGLIKEGGDLGKEAVIRFELRKGAGPKAHRMIKEVSKEIYDGLTKAEEITLNRIIESRRTMQIGEYKPDVKHPSGFTKPDHEAYLDTIHTVGPAKFDKLNERADRYFKFWDDILELKKDAGLLDEDSYQNLKKYIYSPRKYIQHMDPENPGLSKIARMSVTNSGIKSLEEGSWEFLEGDSRMLLAEGAIRTHALIFNNNANRALYELAKQIPENQVVTLAKRYAKERKPTVLEQILEEKPPKREIRFQKAPAGFDKISVMIEGKPHEMIMPQQLAREWVANDPALSEQIATFIGWVSGSKILKPMATGINPEFVMTNTPRDIALVLISTTEYSPHLPIAMAQMAKDFAETRHDVMYRTGSYVDAINEGIGMDFLTLQGKLVRSGGKIGAIQDVLAYAGETSELWTRLALRNRALKNGKSPHEATWIARHYLDFAQGGHIIKGLDKGIPYLSPSIQGTRAIVRAAKENPGVFLYKVGQVAIVSSGLYLANSLSNPECWDQISASDKARYWIITTPFSYIDEAGNRRWIYGRIAKDQGQRIFSTIFESLMAKFMGKEVDVDQVTSAAEDFLPIIPTEMMPPTFDAMFGYYANKDFWRNDDIWKKGEVSAFKERTVYTHPALIKIGELSAEAEELFGAKTPEGISPERLRYALQQYFTYGNIYTSIVGGALSQIMESLPQAEREKTMIEMLIQAPFIRKVLKSTDPYTPFEKPIEEIRKQENTRMYDQTLNLDIMAEKYYGAKTAEGLREARGFINQQPWQDRARLIQRFTNYGKLYRIPDRRWWLNLGDMTPEGRAVMYWSRWTGADKEERARLEGVLKVVPNIASERFFIKLGQLKRKGGAQ